ncbi:60S ribosomal protein L10a [Camellia lanceoleosa]|uniref:60S ribosomal protein L10a n=1 Tax=Camellia lanceoleosa TaxID=1840588 RepID=A0ACC0GZE5_9ERIC|nr:60S ribosomal protein L10a [Camellia lanceoleosa]
MVLGSTSRNPYQYGKLPTLVTHQEPVESKVNETKATVKFQQKKKTKDDAGKRHLISRVKLVGQTKEFSTICITSDGQGTMVPRVKIGRRKRATSGNVLSTSEACQQEIGTPMTFSDEMQPPDDTQTVVEETQPGGVAKQESPKNKDA